MNRKQILAQYRQRIQHGDRIKLTAQERSVLINDFIAQLRRLDQPDAIEQLCSREIALLEEGYGQGSNSTTNYVSRYRTAIAQAVERGELPMTPRTTLPLGGQKQATGKPLEAANHLAWSLMRYESTAHLEDRQVAQGEDRARRDKAQASVPNLPLKAAQLLQSDTAEALEIPEDSAPAKRASRQSDISQSIQSIARELQQLPSKQAPQTDKPKTADLPSMPIQPVVAAGQPARQLELVRLVQKPESNQTDSSASPKRQEPPSTSQVPSSLQPAAKSGTKALAVEPDLLTAAANQLGLAQAETRGQGDQELLHQILEQVVAGALSGPNSRGTASLNGLDGAAVSKHLVTLTQEVAALRQQIQTGSIAPEASTTQVADLKHQLQQMQRERDRLQQQLTELQNSQPDRDQLQAQLKSTQNRLNQFLQLAQDTAVQVAPVQKVASTSTQPTQSVQPAQQLTPSTTASESAKTTSAKTTSDRTTSARTTSARTTSDRTTSARTTTARKLPPDERIQIALDALIRYNQSCKNLRQRWFISINVIADMTGTNPATKVKPWLEEHPDAARRIALHNQQMGINQSHHNRGKDKGELKTIYQAAVT